MADHDDDPVELTVRLPADVVRRIETMTPGARLPDVVREGVAALLAMAEEGGWAPPAEAGPPADRAAPEPEVGTTEEAGAAVASAPASLAVLAVGDAAEVLARLDGLREAVEGLRAAVDAQRARIGADEGRERRTQVWIKTTLAELMAHTTPFATAADERARRRAAAERLGRVDERVHAYVENGRDLNGTGGETPATA